MNQHGAYGLAARDYFNSGWSPIPLPPGSKTPPADGTTGAEGKFVDELMLKRWLKGGKAEAGKLNWPAPSGGIALRVPPNVIGIDVDMYEGKAGQETFRKALDEWGELPATWYTTSRDDGSGIRLYRIPEGLAWPGKLPQGGGVELVRWDHRYAICGPTVHPDTGKRYLWCVEDEALTTGAISEANREPWGYVALEEFPDIDMLPELPGRWVEGLTSGKKWVERAAADLDVDDVRLWLSDRNPGEPCTVMSSTLRKYERSLREASDDGGAHDVARNAAWAVIGDAQAGHCGVEKALNKLKKVFVAAIARRSDKRLAGEEWTRIVVRGVQKVVAEGAADAFDICGLLKTGGESGGDESLRSSADGGDTAPARELPAGHFFPRTDAGNAERLALTYRGEQHYVEGIGWLIWNTDEKRWVPDSEGEMTRRAIAVARGIMKEAELLAEENPKEAAAIAKHARNSEAAGKLDAMTRLARDLRGVGLPRTAFDADGQRLGPLLLKPNPGVEVGAAIPEHRVTMRLGTPYKKGAKAKVWSEFLDRFQPDEEIRDWLQKLVGYSLQGGNPERLLIIGFGPTSTGKTTFLNVILRALGDYAGMVNMTVYRDNQDDKPRPDLLRVVSKRVVMSEETSSAWHLHADQIKRITGGSPLVARGMRSDRFLEMVPAFTPWIFANNPPTIEGADSATLRRLLVVPWEVQVPKGEEDFGIVRDLLGETGLKAALCWALEGWNRYAQDRDLAAPVGAWSAHGEFVAEMSDFDRALREIAVIDENASVLPVVLYNAYRHWASLNNLQRTESATKFGTFLNGRGYEKRQKKVDGTPTWLRFGIRLTTEYERIFST